MSGGPSHIDTFDPKPGTSVGGPFKAIRTSMPGVSISDTCHRSQALAHKMAIVRKVGYAILHPGISRTHAQTPN
jgi:hypothetical protein